MSQKSKRPQNPNYVLSADIQHSVDQRDAAREAGVRAALQKYEDAPLIEDWAVRLAQIDGRKKHYLLARLAEPSKTKQQVMLDMQMHPATVYSWREEEAFKSLDDDIHGALKLYCYDVAADVFRAGAIGAAEALVEPIGWRDQPGSNENTARMRLKQDSARTVLEGSGILKGSSGVQVSIDNRQVHLDPKELWALGGAAAWKHRGQLTEQPETAEEGEGSPSPTSPGGSR